MRNLEFKDQLHEYSTWREQLIQAIEMYREWRNRYKFNDPQSTDTLLNILQGLNMDRVTLAFVAEFSRGKTELINALFFCRNRREAAAFFAWTHHYVAYRTVLG
jgi:hypothetical protein